ncbi:MAG: endonuclease/exonuclease/phosphatase family protein [Burkholderiales bacterium]|uniref:endonuclease/exonuclease/phosphatase family protein n=1 Tax=Inhella sp. TaxID=1921806 RepID=UPI001AC51FFA|nr:endonuclease/exonuclease/phosphatase family protein [Burkholderiales bacterium]
MSRLRIATYNIHKGVRGAGPAKRLEIHALQRGVHELGADLVCLQEVRAHHHGDARRFHRHWPQQAQADFLAPDGYQVAYRSNAYTRGGEHGNALLSRFPLIDIAHHDVSDHRLEQRGLLHVTVDWLGAPLHVLVLHLGLFHGSRLRQVQALGRYLASRVPQQERLLVAGDFNDWREQLDPGMAMLGLQRAATAKTFPARAPLFALDRVYLRGLQALQAEVPRGAPWVRMSDHLPLLVEVEAL